MQLKDGTKGKNDASQLTRQCLFLIPHNQQQHHQAQEVLSSSSLPPPQADSAVPLRTLRLFNLTSQIFQGTSHNLPRQVVLLLADTFESLPFESFFLEFKSMTLFSHLGQT